MKYDVKDDNLQKSIGDETSGYQKNLKRNISIYSAKADMDFPLSDKGNLSYGIAYSYTSTENKMDYTQSSLKETQNNHFLYKENVAAAYIDMTYSFSKKLSSKFGIRTEYTETKGESYISKDIQKNNYFRIFPTAYLAYSFREDNVLSFNITSRIIRPDFSDVDPFVNYLDAHNCEIGNPQLQPEKHYSLQLGYTLGNLNVSCSYEYKNDGIAYSTNIDAENHMVSSIKGNIMEKSMFRFEASYFLAKYKCFNSYIMGVFMPYRAKANIGTETLKASTNTVFFFMDNNLYFNRAKTWSLNIWWQYNSPETYAIAKTDERYQVGTGMKWQLFNRSLDIGIYADNLFANTTIYREKSNEMSKITRYSPYRIWRVALSYKFGKKLISHNRKQSNSDLLNRL